MESAKYGTAGDIVQRQLLMVPIPYTGYCMFYRAVHLIPLPETALHCRAARRRQVRSQIPAKIATTTSATRVSARVGIRIGKQCTRRLAYRCGVPRPGLTCGSDAGRGHAWARMNQSARTLPISSARSQQAVRKTAAAGPRAPISHRLSAPNAFPHAWRSEVTP